MPKGPARSAELTTKPSAGDLVPLTRHKIVYHEVHEDHEVYFNKISLCVLRALRGDIFLSLQPAITLGTLSVGCLTLSLEISGS